MIEDRPYQRLAIEKLRQGFRDNHRRQVLSASTGAGKSVVMLQMIKSAIAKGSKILFICERRVLVDQFSRHLDANGIEHGVIMAKHWRYRPDAMVQVATAQTLERMETWPKFDICFVDEIHACLRASLKKLMRARPDLRVIGATATPFNPALGHYFSSVTSVITMKELVDQGFLVPYRVFVATEIDTKDVAVVAGEWKQDELESEFQMRCLGGIAKPSVSVAALRTVQTLQPSLMRLASTQFRSAQTTRMSTGHKCWLSLLSLILKSRS